MKPLLWFTALIFAASVAVALYEIHLDAQAKRISVTVHAAPSPWGAAKISMTPDGKACTGVWWRHVVTEKYAHTDDCIPPHGEGVDGVMKCDGPCRFEGAVAP